MFFSDIKSYAIAGLLAICIAGMGSLYILAHYRQNRIEALQTQNTILEGNASALETQVTNLGESLRQSTFEAEQAQAENIRLSRSIDSMRQFLDANRLNLRTLRNSPQANAALNTINRQVECLLTTEDVASCANIPLPSLQSASPQP